MWPWDPQPVGKFIPTTCLEGELKMFVNSINVLHLWPTPPWPKSRIYPEYMITNLFNDLIM